MRTDKREHPKEKTELHPRNKHRRRYNFHQLIKSCPDLKFFVKLNEYKDETIDFFNPEAVKMLNWALLKHYYNINYWDIPANYLCPPIPGRADYLHHAADLLASCNQGDKVGKIPRDSGIKCLDVGVGANCVYPIIGHTEYGWSFVGSDIDAISIESANKIIEMNPALTGQVECRLQPNNKHYFINIIQPGERFDLTICNPPFHASAAEARAGTFRKVTNLTQKKGAKPLLNFGGQSNELWCMGGEKNFVTNMIRESRQFANSCFWFTTLVSKSAHLKTVYKSLQEVKAVEVKTIEMSQGNKTSRLVAWTFLPPAKQQEWIKERWKKLKR
ncbi:23S rRNA (adenine(1618)-N(6))-methyltransferase RlmF [Adhaeribacter aquaticus]|uniref:23S rRNA (adenine(1618)-N(6))-methyltransferase RlmF n=1 Tax=Adhaeribacter aquaticus TaxID=299567 RepID=UPI0003FEDB86|nr:23S rRNA (adenine(1618)-N(6))-methyltransferase RlmF [Adhaeribacter aquaticus]